MNTCECVCVCMCNFSYGREAENDDRCWKWDKRPLRGIEKPAGKSECLPGNNAEADRMANQWETNGCCRKGGDANVLIKAPAPCPVITERAEPSHTGLGWWQTTPHDRRLQGVCWLQLGPTSPTDDLRDNRTYARCCRWYMVKPSPFWRMLFWHWRWGSLKICVSVANITNELISGLDILCTYDASVDLGGQMLRLPEEALLLWSPGAGPGLPTW